MKNKFLLFAIPFLLLGIVSLSNASVIQPGSGIGTVIEEEAGWYENNIPDNYSIIAAENPYLSHQRYYTWGLEDIPHLSSSTEFIDIVFRGIYDTTEEANSLEVYLFNEPEHLGLDWGDDFQNTGSPDWSLYNATFLGSWQYDHGQDGYDQPDDRYDLVFRITNPDLLSYFRDGDSFGIGIDPDCHYIASSVEVVAPVPEPHSMILFGVGLLGVAGLTRRNLKV